MNSQYKTNLYWITIQAGVTDWVSRSDSSGKSGVTRVDTQNITNNHKEPKRIATRISKDFQPSKELLDWQSKNFPEANVELETAKFTDFFLSSPKGVKLDWDAAWRNWIRNGSKPKPWARKNNSKALEEWAND